MHGFDIWLDEHNAAAMYQGLLDDCRTMLDSVGVATIPVTTNYHELPLVWGHNLVNHLAAASRLFAGRFDSALVANGVTYARLGVRWGVHPQPLSYLDSRHFRVADDGAEASRLEKITLLAQWPEAMRHLRVCFENPGSHTNCCRCEKCYSHDPLLPCGGSRASPGISRGCHQPTDSPHPFPRRAKALPMAGNCRQCHSARLGTRRLGPSHRRHHPLQSPASLLEPMQTALHPLTQPNPPPVPWLAPKPTGTRRPPGQSSSVALSFGSAFFRGHLQR